MRLEWRCGVEQLRQRALLWQREADMPVRPKFVHVSEAGKLTHTTRMRTNHATHTHALTRATSTPRHTSAAVARVENQSPTQRCVLTVPIGLDGDL